MRNKESILSLTLCYIVAVRSQLCSPGTYSANGLSPCTACATFSTSGSGATKCTCDAGYMQPDTGKNFCYPQSAVGYYSPPNLAGTDAGLLAYYSFWEGNRLYDWAEKLGPLTSVGTFAYSVNKPYPGSDSVFFDGGTTKKMQTSNVALNTSACTICLWVQYIGTIPSNSVVFHYAKGLYNGIRVSCLSTGVAFATMTGSNSGGSGVNAFGIETGWKHLCFRMQEYTYVFIDGGLVYTLDNFLYGKTGSGFFTFGGGSGVLDTYGTTMYGLLDDIRIYNTLISDAAISAVYQYKLYIPCVYAVTTGMTSCSPTCASDAVKISDQCFCNPGFYGTGVTCSKCPAGTYSSSVGITNVTQCISCQAGTYSTALGGSSITSSCISCAAGKYSTVLGAFSSSTCTACVAGTYSSVINAMSSSVCSGCTSGKYSTVLGAFSSTVCTLCGAGTYQSGTGSSTCTLCSAGRYSTSIGLTNLGQCPFCGKGTYSSSLGITSASNCMLCEAGRYFTGLGLSLSSQCLSCAAGTFSTSLGAFSVGTCTQCASGTYSSTVGASTLSTCLPCAAGRYFTGFGISSSAACASCEAGKYSTGLGSADVDMCTSCASGTYSTVIAAPSSSLCVSCAAGTYSTASGLPASSQCASCSTGTYSASGSTECALCAAESYAPTTGTSTCTACPSNSTAPALGSAYCTCNPSFHIGYVPGSQEFDTRNGGAIGSQGPDGTVLYVQNSFANIVISSGTLTVNGNTIPRGYQIATVLNPMNVTIIAAGARGVESNCAGCAGCTVKPGRGVVIKTTASLAAGDRLVLAVGQYAPINGNSGGGGATYVTKYNGGVFSTQTNHVLLLAAGGGGGSGTCAYDGKDALITTQGGLAGAGISTPATDGYGGGCDNTRGGTAALNPAGGSGGAAGASCGGGGFRGSRGGTSWISSGTTSFLTGGYTTAVFGSAVQGGFPGGGAATLSGGGGAGYSGGQGAGTTSTILGGGGGGSYDHRSTDNSATLVTTWDSDAWGPVPASFQNGYNYGHGFVKFFFNTPEMLCKACKQCDAFGAQTASCDAASETDTVACTCNSGYFGTGFTCSACKVCDANADQTSVCTETSDAGCACKYGYYGDGVQCTECEENFSCENGVKTACQANSFSPPGSATCTCNPGFYGPSCTICPANSYCTNGALTACPVHSTASLGSSTCVCDAGFYGPDCSSMCEIGYTCSNGVQTPCPANMTSGGGASACVCVAGMEMRDNACTLCGAGQYSLAGSNCSECSQGFYSGSSGASSCLVCDAGMFNSAPGSSDCAQCPINSWCAAGTRNTCPLHSSSNAASMSQHACLCDAGFFGDGSISGTSPCAQCWPNYYCPGGNNNLSTLCPAHSRSDPGSSSVSQCVCKDGFVRMEDTCICAPDHFCPDDESSVCPANSSSPLNSSSISDCVCDPGFYGTAAEGCSACPVGSYCVGDGSATACTGNATTASERSIAPADCFCDRGFAGVNNTECEPCPVGQWCWTGVANLCPDHSTSPLFSNYMQNCTCVPGYYGEDGGPCYNCAPGQYCEGAQSVEQCPDNSVSDEKAASIADCLCVAGFVRLGNSCVCAPGTRPYNDSTCVTCEDNTWCENNVQTQCEYHRTAPPGSSTSDACLCVAGHGGSVCDPCEPGWFKSGVGNHECSACAPGTYGLEDAATACTACDSGSVAVESGRNTSCDVCPLSMYAADAASPCAPCFARAVTRQPGSSSIDACLCEADFYLSEGSCVPCSECSEFATQRRFCELGSSSDVVECTCHAGFSGDGKSCALCPNGTWSSIGGQCVACEENTFCALGVVNTCPTDSVSAAGSASISDCICTNGFYRDNDECISCPAGSKCADETMVPCEPGSFQDAEGQSQCYLCALGMYGETSGLTGCTECPLGTVVNVSSDGETGPATSALGATSRFNCSCGLLAMLVDGTCGEYCAPGYYYDAECILCPQGFECTENKRTPCASQYSALPGSSACSLCAGPNTHSSVSLATCGLLACAESARQPIADGLSGVGNLEVDDKQVRFVLDPFHDRPVGILFVQLDPPVVMQAHVRGAAQLDIGTGDRTLLQIGLLTDAWRDVQVYFDEFASGDAWIRAASPVSGSELVVRDVRTMKTLPGPLQWQPLSAMRFGENDRVKLLSDVWASVSLLVEKTYELRFWNSSGMAITYYEVDGVWTQTQGNLVPGAATRLRIVGGVEIEHPDLRLVGPPCHLCIENHFCADEFMLPCPLFMRSQPGSSQCSCVTGRAGDACLQCAPGHYGESCALCEPGYYCPGLGQEATPCPAGSASSAVGAANTDTCIACATGSWARSGETVCSPCAPGSYSVKAGLADQAQCDVCPVGQFCGGGAQIEPCSAGTWSDKLGLPARSQCSPCPGGSFCRGGADRQPCPLGTFSPGANLSQASQCPLCSSGFYCPDPLTKVPCPEYTLSDAGSHDLQSCLCLPGYKCSYNNVVHAQVVLPVALEDFESIREQYIAAVAAAAGVDVSQVEIVSITSAPAGSGGGRRLRAERNFVEVHVSIRRQKRNHKRTARRLDEKLNAYLAPHNLQTVLQSVKVHREVVASKPDTVL